MPASDGEKAVVEESSSTGHIEEEPDVEFGGTEARKALEKRLLLKLDLRMSIMVFIYILNYVSVHLLMAVSIVHFPPDRQKQCQVCIVAYNRTRSH